VLVVEVWRVEVCPGETVGWRVVVSTAVDVTTATVVGLGRLVAAAEVAAGVDDATVVSYTMYRLYTVSSRHGSAQDCWALLHLYAFP